MSSVRPLRAAVRAGATLVAGLAVSAAAVATDAACGSAHRWTTAAGAYRIAFTPRPEPLAVGRHFTLDLQLCAEAGTPAVRALHVDADMPAHRHGMNYQARVKR